MSVDQERAYHGVEADMHEYWLSCLPHSRSFSQEQDTTERADDSRSTHALCLFRILWLSMDQEDSRRIRQPCSHLRPFSLVSPHQRKQSKRTPGIKLVDLSSIPPMNMMQGDKRRTPASYPLISTRAPRCMHADNPIKMYENVLPCGLGQFLCASGG